MVRIYFPKIPLVLTSPNSLEAANGVNTLVFRTIPEVGKLQLKNFLASVYGFDIKAVHTINYEGKKKRNPKTGRYYRKPDWKKAYVLLNDAVTVNAQGNGRGFAASGASTTPLATS